MSAVMQVSVWVSAGSPMAASWFREALPASVAFTSLHGDQGTTVILNSPRFKELDEQEALEPYIDQVLERMTALLHVYYPALGALSFGVQQIAQTLVDGRHGARKKITVSIVAVPDEHAPAAVAQMFQLAETDEAVAHALRLIRTPAIDWPGVYDVIEFLIHKGAVSSNNETLRRHRQIANHFRHLARPDKFPPGESPPTLAESRAYVLGLLETWLAKRQKAAEATSTR